MMDIGGCGSSEPFALRVLGDSMTPEFEDGCVIVIDPSGVIENGCYVIAMHDDEYIFRQLVIDDNRYYLKPLNEGYDVLEIPDTEAIKGVIVQKAGTRRHHRKHYV
jgi:DNA polymerase V